MDITDLMRYAGPFLHNPNLLNFIESFEFIAHRDYSNNAINRFINDLSIRQKINDFYLNYANTNNPSSRSEILDILTSFRNSPIRTYLYELFIEAFDRGYYETKENGGRIKKRNIKRRNIKGSGICFSNNSVSPNIHRFSSPYYLTLYTDYMDDIYDYIYIIQSIIDSLQLDNAYKQHIVSRLNIIQLRLERISNNGGNLSDQNFTTQINGCLQDLRELHYYIDHPTINNSGDRLHLTRNLSASTIDLNGGNIPIKYVCLGGKLNVKTLQQVIKNGYKKDKTNKLDGYILDHELSGSRAQVYHNEKNNKTIINHRGTQGFNDLITDLKLSLGKTNNKRFNHGKNITDNAIEKYANSDFTITGHSLGAKIAKEANKKHNKDI